MNEQFDFIKIITSRLEEANIPYMMTGSMAMAIYAIPRMTRDIDIVLEIKISDIDKFVNLFKDDCYIDENSVKDAIFSHGMFNIIHNEWILKADFIVRKNNEYRENEFLRRRKIDLDEKEIYIVSPEDLILSKLLWDKQLSSEMQLRDVKMIIAGSEKLDWLYLEKWAKEIQVYEKLIMIRKL